MKVAVIGATGLMGTSLVPEAASRGHEVTAICRHPEQIPSLPNVTPVKCDVMDEDALAAVLRSHDAVIHSYSPRRDFTVNRTGPHRAATQAIINATKRAGIKRLLAVGGAGTLKLPDGSRVVDAPTFPPEWLESAHSTAEVLYMLREEPTLDWTFLSPSLFFDERGRSGKFRLGKDDALFDETGQSRISIPDYAVAMIDELEKPRHTHQRFTVGY
jgi:uncharacterized protein